MQSPHDLHHDLRPHLARGQVVKEEDRRRPMYGDVVRAVVHQVRSNRVMAAEGEGEEWTNMYPTMAKDAREEGFDEIARVLEGIGKIEREHQERYKALLSNLESGSVFQKKQNSVYC